jgi:hypothetical protein
LQRLRSNADLQLLRELVQKDLIKPIEESLLTKPFTDLSEVRYLQGQLHGLKAVFARLDFLSKPKQYEEKEV